MASLPSERSPNPIKIGGGVAYPGLDGRTGGQANNDAIAVLRVAALVQKDIG